MQILKRSKGVQDGDMVSAFASEKDLKEEINSRTAKAGYTTKYGECPCRTKIQNSIPFGKQKLNVWPRDEQGNFIGD